MNLDLLSPVADMANKVLDKIIPDANQRAEAQARVLELQQAGEFRELDQRMAAIIIEAQSSDPWTSRARPSFMYVFYLILIFLILVMPGVGVFFPDRMDLFFANVAKGFQAIPEPMWWTFGAGYLGYTHYRSGEKKARVNG